jgi:hypothetical protein
MLTNPATGTATSIYPQPRRHPNPQRETVVTPNNDPGPFVNGLALATGLTWAVVAAWIAYRPPSAALAIITAVAAILTTATVITYRRTN